MKRYGKWIKLAVLLCAAITIVSAPMASLAYIAANSNTLHNSFRVEYQPAQDISVPIVIHKSMVNLSDADIGPGGFDFYLIDAETGKAASVKSSDAGWATINVIFTAEDAGKTYNYRLYELNDGRENVIYDGTVYDISITILMDDANVMSAELRMDGQIVTEIVAEYENRYYVPVPLPDTGDHTPLALWTAMLVFSGTGLVVFGKKRKVSRRPSWIKRKFGF